jgi:membrane-bound lytic murein transglycosylase D
MRRRASTLAIAMAVAVTAAAAGHAEAAATTGDPFPRYRQLEPAVAFWRDVFAKYTRKQIVFHDPYHLDLVYAVDDVSHLMRGDGTDAVSQRAVRNHIASRNSALAATIRRLAHSAPVTQEERYIAAAMAAAAEPLPSYAELAGRIRTQRGLGDELCGTIERAQAWLPEMKQILASHGVPVELSSLPVVESGFRTNAHSFVGAAGIWQFTRGTGRRYLRIDQVVDERRDPLLATEAAGRYLRENFETLGTWPLAITAYNHGEGGMAKASRELGTTDLGVIVKHYKGRSFGFASRNFYAEFLAAHDVMQAAETHCGAIVTRHQRLEKATIDAYVPLSALARAAGVDTLTLAELNPALQRDVTHGRLLVPRGYRLWLPSGTKAAFEVAYAQLPSSVVRSSQPSLYATHRVRPGQTLSQIAAMYRTSVSTLQRHNGIRNARSLRAGQTLKIPGAAASVASAPASQKASSAASSAAASEAPTYVMHTVARGQTLSSIAKRYGASTTSIQRFNGISDPRSLKAGQRVKIPRSGAKTVAAFKTHRVGRGQTLSQIADLYRTTVSTLQKANGISDPRRLKHGQVLRIPM